MLKTSTDQPSASLPALPEAGPCRVVTGIWKLCIFAGEALGGGVHVQGSQRKLGGDQKTSSVL
jgi:hypothetical protein